MLIQRYNYKPVLRETIAGKRHYCLPDGSKVASVTTILDATKSEESKQALQNWRKRVGPQKAQEITTEAAGRGTRMHKWLEDYVKTDVLGEPGSNPYSQQSHNMAKTIIAKGLAHADEIWGMEVPLYYTGLYAGTSDCIGRWKQNPAIMDFKQTNKLKKREWIDDYFLQLLFYGTAHNNTYGTDIRTGVILMCTPDNVYQEFVIEGEEWNHYENIMWDRLENYYKIP